MELELAVGSVLNWNFYALKRGIGGLDGEHLLGPFNFLYNSR
jgi:hypothetical protein